MKRTFLGLAPLTLAVASLTLACNDDAPGTTTDDTGDTTGDGDGDAGDGDGDTGDGDGDGDAGDGDGDTGGPDGDMDGVPDASDNCPAVANPNQLDFDGNGAGNVCDVLMFSTVAGTLNTTASADAGIGGSCMIPIAFEVISGQILVQLDDDAAVAGFEIVNLEIADILDQQCNLIVEAVVSMTDFSIANGGGMYPVSIAHTLAQHDGGVIAGNSDMPHPVLSSATLSASIMGGDPTESPLDLDGALPIFTGNVMDAGATGTLSWADANFVIAEDVFDVEMPIQLQIMFNLTGLVGSLNVAP